MNTIKEVCNDPNLVCRLFTIMNCEISIITIVAGLVRLDQTDPLDFEDPRNQGNRLRGGASAPPRTRLGVPPSKFCSARYRHFENLVSRKIRNP